ncbi:MAG: HEAT repeat domain-containing protein [Chloroflexaceae bacterium]|jgi:ATP/maltotriose-dependent transcriptional regulator MalT/DNA-binding SARP family transcriptional activator|nr:HEAT repeat domain-containing protein [Chloroflexaceae bacterium]
MTQLLDLQAASPLFPALLPLKLMPPPSRGDVVLRPELQALLAEVRLQPATMVVAPAGYGKTTLLTSWADELSRTGATVAWLGLEADERDPALLLAYLVRAFQTQLPEVGDQAWRILHSGADFSRDWPLVAGALLSDLQTALAKPTYLFLDDVQTISDGPITAPLLGYLLRAAPPALHIVLASRRPLSFAPLPRLRAEGAVVEVAQHDLSLSESEANALLARHHVQLSPDELKLLLHRTEGWALSMQLIVRALARQPAERRGSYLHALDAHQQSLFDYLASEVLADLPPDLADFLALAALPDQFDAALLAEVLDRPNIATLIDQAQGAGLPLTVLEEGDEASRRTYRFHPLWRALLYKRAESLLDRDSAEAIQRRFGRAFASRGDLEAALKHFAAINDNESIARALREWAWPLVNTPQRDTIRRWLEQLPPAVRDHDPELLHMWGWTQFIIAPDEATGAISRAAEVYRESGAHQRELRALADLAALLIWEDRVLNLEGSAGVEKSAHGFAAICVRAVRAANHVRDAWARGTALVNVVALLYSKGRYGAALRVAKQAVAHPRSPFWQWLLSLTVSSIHIQQGHPAAALAAIGEALAVPKIDRDDRLRQYLLHQQGLARYQLGQQSEALELALESHQRLTDYYNDGVVGTSAAWLALLLLEGSRPEESATYLARAHAIGNRSGLLALLARVQVLEAYRLLRLGQNQQAAIQAAELLKGWRPDGDESSAASFRSTDMWLRLPLALALGEGGDSARALVLLNDTVAQMHGRGDGLFLVLAYLYRALLHGRTGDSAAQQHDLQAGWELADRHDYGFLPLLPAAVLRALVADALRLPEVPAVVSRVLRRQLPDHATTLLLELTQDSAASVRARAADLLGDLGAANAYPSLRAMLKDRSPQARSAAEQALGRLVYRPPYRLRIRTLGAFEIWRGDEEVRDRDWRSAKARQLLQFFLVERGRMIARDRIMDVLWPGLETESASNNLRVTLSRLTRALEPERPEGAPTYYIVQQGDTYGFNIGSDHQFDAADFTDAVERGRVAERRSQRDEAEAAYRQAIKLYGGAFLPDSLYEDWSVVERERLELLFNDGALRLGNLLLEQGRWHEAIGLAWRVLEHDQAQEEAYRLLMKAHARLGERSTAMRLYTRCVTALQTELGVEPLPETVALYEELRRG